MKKTDELKNFLQKRPYLCWWVKDIGELSDRAAVEATLNNGDWAEVQELIKIMGPKKVAQIFFKESSKTRQNYRPRTKHFFSLYLKKYTTQNIQIKEKEELAKYTKSPNSLTLAAMKAHALSRRNKWKDYVDLYFIIKDHHSLKEIIKTTKKIFKTEFNERIFREALSYFKDIDYSEEVNFLPQHEVSNNIVKRYLKAIAITD